MLTSSRARLGVLAFGHFAADFYFGICIPLPEPTLVRHLSVDLLAVMAILSTSAIIVNAIFFQSTLFSFATSAFVVLAFSAITAWETQIIKQMYVAGETGTTAKQKSIFGAFMLYGSFVTMFIHILNMLGIMSGD